MMRHDRQETQSLVRFETLQRLLVFGATLAAIAIVLFFALTLFVMVPQLSSMTEGAVARWVTAWAPVPLYVWAIWQSRTLFARLSPDPLQGHGVLSRGLVQIGIALSLTAMVSGLIGMYLIFSSKAGGNAQFIASIVPQMALCLIGLALAAVGLLLRRSDDVIDENAALKAKLEGFI